MTWSGRKAGQRKECTACVRSKKPESWSLFLSLFSSFWFSYSSATSLGTTKKLNRLTLILFSRLIRISSLKQSIVHKIVNIDMRGC